MMAAAPAASLLAGMLGWNIGSIGADAGNRLSLQGLTTAVAGDGALEIAARQCDVAALRIAAGPLWIEIGSATLHQLTAVIRFEAGTPRLQALGAARCELAGLKVQRTFDLSAASVAPVPVMAAGWSLGPLGTADGSVRARIVDAHLLFDADVTVPIRQGRIDFSDATVAHVGPDSRMGLSPQGLYVDAPNGRTYVYQFSAPPAAGVEFEQRGALLAPWMVTQRGRLQVQPFAEALLREGAVAAGVGVTAQTRQLLERTSLAGDVQLGDGTVTGPGLRMELAGRAQGCNAVRLQSASASRAVTVDVPSLFVHDAALDAGALQLGLEQAGGEVVARLTEDGPRVRAVLEAAKLELAGLRLQPRRVA